MEKETDLAQKFGVLVQQPSKYLGSYFKLRGKQTDLAQKFGLLVQQPSKYLCSYFKLRGKRILDFQDLIDKLNLKLQEWKAQLYPRQAGPHL